MGRERAGPSDGLAEYQDAEGDCLKDMENQGGCSKDNDTLGLDLSGGSESDSSSSNDGDTGMQELYACECAKLKALKRKIQKSLKTNAHHENFAKYSKDAFTRFSVKMYSSVLAALDEHQKSIISKYGFGFLLLFQKCIVPNKFAKWLARHVDWKLSQIIVNGNGVLLTPESVHLVLGLPIGGNTFPPISTSNAVKSKILSMFGKTSMPQVHFFASKLINKDPMSDEETFICFMLVALNSFLCPNSSLIPSSSYLGAFDEIEKVKDFNWSKLLLDWLLDKIKDFTRSNKGSKTLGGCLYYLAVVYLDSIDFGNQQVLGGIPRIAVWKNDMIKTYSELDSTGPRQYGHRQLLCPSKTCYAKVIGTRNTASSPLVNSQFKLKLDECCGGQLPECLKNDILKLINKFSQTSRGCTNLDLTCIGGVHDEIKSTISRILNQLRNVDSDVQGLVIEVLELVYGFNKRAGNDESICLKGVNDTSTHANTPAREDYFTEGNINRRHSQNSIARDVPSPRTFVTPQPVHTFSSRLPNCAPSAPAHEQMKARSEICRNYATETHIASLRDPRCIISDDEGSQPSKKAKFSTPTKRAGASSDIIYLDNENSSVPDSATPSVEQSMPRYCSQKFYSYYVRRDEPSAQCSVRNPLTPIQFDNLEVSSEGSQRITPRLTKSTNSLPSKRFINIDSHMPTTDQRSSEVEIIGEKRMQSRILDMTKKLDMAYNSNMIANQTRNKNHETDLPQGTAYTYVSPQGAHPFQEDGDAKRQYSSSGGKLGHYGPRRMLKPTVIMGNSYENMRISWHVTSSEYDNYEAICELASSNFSKPRGFVNNFVVAVFCRHLFLKPDGHPGVSKNHYFFPSISLFFPTCYESHWFVFVVDIKDQCFVFLDSHYNSKDEFHTYVREMMVPSFVFHWNKYIKAKKPFDEFDILYPDMPNHGPDKMYDSGIYAMMALQYWTSPRPMLSTIFEPKDALKIRAKIANDLIFTPRNTGRKDLITSYRTQQE
ncbi:hypothetical protein U9M48_000204 [Paspalum notatum var. saurae]|uniref:Ubiquitin-like protease family profile domain-containing protein n=1 Tax=Paspalum notatum var. saurae TaxID=547442 RepID=A0AAQ3SHA3_PASNO